jgi:protein-S-isoprenylcysteine O-methyltransferase Ste14
MTRRIAVFAYGVISYALFFATFLYALGFVGNFAVPKSVDGVGSMAFAPALAIDLALLTLFAVQHSVMARPVFKRWLTRHVPQSAERSTYVLASSIALLVLFGYWQPLGGTIWQVQHPVAVAALYGLFAFGWGLVLVTTFLINHFDLFGLRQVWLYLRGEPYSPLAFKTPAIYRHVRHPLYLGWLFAFWATPTMSAAHLMFAIVTTAYILFAIRFEERDLLAEHGATYEDYRRRVPMIVPSLRRRARTSAPVPSEA